MYKKRVKGKIRWYKTMLRDSIREIDDEEAMCLIRKEELPYAARGYRLGLKIGLSYLEDIEEE